MKSVHSAQFKLNDSRKFLKSLTCVCHLIKKTNVIKKLDFCNFYGSVKRVNKQLTLPAINVAISPNRKCRISATNVTGWVGDGSWVARHICLSLSTFKCSRRRWITGENSSNYGRTSNSIEIGTDSAIIEWIVRTQPHVCEINASIVVPSFTNFLPT